MSDSAGGHFCHDCNRIILPDEIHMHAISQDSYDAVIKERDSYKKAKEENDERFQLENAKLTKERDKLKSKLAVFATLATEHPCLELEHINAKLTEQRDEFEKKFVKESIARAMIEGSRDDLREENAKLTEQVDAFRAALDDTPCNCKGDYDHPHYSVCGRCEVLAKWPKEK